MDSCFHQQLLPPAFLRLSMVSPSFPHTSTSREGGLPESITEATFTSVYDELMLKAVCPLHCPHSLLAFRGRQPLWGTGVLSVMEMTSKPPIVSPLMAACNGTADDSYQHTEQQRREKAHGKTVSSPSEDQLVPMLLTL